MAGRVGMNIFDESPRDHALKTMRFARARFRRDLAANYHSYLASIISSASPLLLDVCSEWRIDEEAMLRRIRPPAGWPYHNKRGVGISQPPRAVGMGLDGQAVRALVRDRTLEARAWIGPAFACTGDGELQLWLHEQIPATIQLCLPGRELATVVNHPILRMRPYRIIRSRCSGHGTIIAAAAPNAPYTMPWARS